MVDPKPDQKGRKAVSLNAFKALLGRELRLAARQPGDAIGPVGFFVIAAAMFPFGVGPGPETLARIAPGIVWVTALLAALLAVERLFQADQEDGSLDLLLIAPLSTEWVIAAKALTHWLLTGLPLIATAPLIGLMLQLPDAGYAPLMLGMALGTPTMSLIGTVGAALTVGARRSGLLLALLILPLYVPILIFGAGAIGAATSGLEARPHLLFLAAFLALSLPVGIFAGAAALRQSAE